jgi:hypothetical protein
MTHAEAGMVRAADVAPYSPDDRRSPTLLDSGGRPDLAGS